MINNGNSEPNRECLRTSVRVPQNLIGGLIYTRWRAHTTHSCCDMSHRERCTPPPCQISPCHNVIFTNIDTTFTYHLAHDDTQSACSHVLISIPNSSHYGKEAARTPSWLLRAMLCNRTIAERSLWLWVCSRTNSLSRCIIAYGLSHTVRPE